MSENKLKPCPFCGSTKLKIESKRTFNYGKKHCSVTDFSDKHKLYSAK